MAELVLLSTPAGCDPPVRVSDRLPLGAAPLSLGNQASDTIRFGHAGPPFSVQVRSQSGGWSLVISGPAPRVRLNGVVVDDRRGVPLSHGDIVHLENGLVARFELTPVRVARSLELELAVARAPDDPGGWAVYRDFLLERGDPLGEWMLRSTGASLEDRRRMLGALAALLTRDSARFFWNAHGFLDQVVLRENALSARLPWFLGELRRLPVARFLRRLWADFYVDGDRTTPPSRDAMLPAFFAELSGAEWLWSLEELFLGHLARARPAPLVAGLLGLREVAPRLTTTLDDVTFTPPAPSEWTSLGADLRGLPAVGANAAQGGEWGFDVLAAPRTVELPGRQSLGFRSSPLVIGSAASAWVRVYDRRVPPLRCALFCNDDGTWWLVVPKDLPGVPVDGEVRRSVTLHEGDVVEPVPGLRLRVDRA